MRIGFAPARLATLALLGAALATPRGAVAQEAAGITALAPSLDPESAAAVTKEIEHARERGLPVEPLLDKVRQGNVMRAPGPRIRAAVTALAGRMASAREALAPSPSTAEIVAGADALSVGASREALTRLKQSIPSNASVAVPLGVLAQLVSRGVPAEKATVMVAQLVKGGAPPATLIALGADVEKDVAAGIPADVALDVRVRGVQMQTGVPGAATIDASAPGALPGTGTSLTGGRKGTPRPKRP
jgi:hypothetical protein